MIRARRQTVGWGRTPPRLVLIVGAVVVVVVVGVPLLIVRTVGGPSDTSASLADGARVTASTTAVGYSPASAVVAHSTMPSSGWKSDAQTVGAWLAVSWSESHEVRSVRIDVPERSAPGVTAGVLSFGDGSSVQVVLADDSRSTVVPITPRSARSVRFTATGFDAGAVATTIDRFVVDPSGDSAIHDPGGDATPTAAISASSGDATGLTSDGGWTVPSPSSASLRFAWDSPRELVGVAIAGSRGSPATIASATLRFGSGGSVAIGAVPADPALPTTVAFMPHVTRSATLMIQGVAGSGKLDIASIRLLERGTDAVPLKTVAPGTSVDALAAASCDRVQAPASVSTLQVLCPQNGARVGDDADLLVAMPVGAVGVAADVWPGSGGATVPTTRAMGTNSVRMSLSLGRLPDGPITVLLTAIGAPRQIVRLQLMHGVEEDRASSASSRASRGKTLVYDDEFDGPLSASRSGDGTRYVAGKSETTAVADFGEAIFADPADGLGNLGVLDDRYLRISVLPKPDGYVDPQGWNRASIGGSISSARPGGSGFSAQYGYFEARMLVPAMPGTWPAFWIMPSTNLTATQKAVAEIDAVELYGHDPLGACESTHQYLDGVSDGGVADCGHRFSSERTAAQWHTYGVDVMPTQVVFYIDGRRVSTAPQVRGGGAPMFVMADLALGGGWPIQLDGTQGRAQLLIDWIRVSV